MSDEEYQIIDPEAARLQKFREVYQNETCKSAIDRTRRAESSARALEAMLIARAENEDVSPSNNFDTISMTSEDYRSRLLSTLEETCLIRSELTELRRQQEADNECIESLQESLERLHVLSSEYRKDRDVFSAQIIEVFEAVRQRAEVSSIEDMIAQFEMGTLSLKGENRMDEIQVKEQEIEKITSRFECVEAEKVKLEQQLGEAESKLVQWNEWSVSVTEELEMKTKEVEICNEQIAILEQDQSEKQVEDSSLAKDCIIDELRRELAKINQVVVDSTDKLKEANMESSRMITDLKERMQFDLSQRDMEISKLGTEILDRDQIIVDMKDESDLLRLRVLELEKVDVSAMEQQLVEWAKWSAEMTTQLAERDEIIEATAAATATAGKEESTKTLVQEAESKLTEWSVWAEEMSTKSADKDSKI